MTVSERVAAGVASVPEWITEPHARFLGDIAAGRKPISADRAEDRVRQKLRSAGYVRFGGKPCRWLLTSAGIALTRAIEASK